MSLHYKKAVAKVGFGEDKTEKYVGRAMRADTMDLEDVAKEISHETAIPKAACETVLRYLPEAITTFIRAGHGVNVGFGYLSPTISTIADENPDKVKIRKKRFVFRVNKKLKAVLADLSLTLEGDEDTDVVDDDTTTGTTPSGGGNTQSGGGLPTGGNEQDDDDTLQP